MDAQAFDVALTDLETRVDRLRALYENWFRGYEKAEPAVARKDVERKVYAMRKELPRNTALRFRYNQLYQRYTTLSNYWQRTARQIEEGTYRLQVQRMRRRNETVRGRADGQHDEQEGERDAAEVPHGLELDLDDDIDVESIFAQVMLDDVEKALTAPGPHVDPVEAAPPRRGRPVGTFARPRRPSERPPAEPAAEHRAPPPAQDVATAPTVPAPPGLVPSVPAVASAASRPAVSAPLPARPAAPAPPVRPAPQSVPGPDAMPAVHIAALQPPAASAPAPKKPGLPPPSSPVVPAARPAPPALSLGLSANPADVAARVAAAKSAGPGLPPSPGLQPAAGVPRAPAVPPVAPPPRVAPPASGVVLREPAAPRADASPVPARMPAAAGAPPSAKPIPAVPVGAPPPAPFAVARPRPPTPSPTAAPSRARDIPGGGTLVGPAPARPAGPASGNIDEHRMRRLVDEYNSARKRNNEGDVRYEAVVQSIQRMLPDLEKKHAGKRIDFEVVMKDGRVGLKPKAV